MLKEKIKESDASLEQAECKWRNVIFDKTGKGYNGYILHNTQTDAQAAFRRMEQEIAGHDCKCVIPTADGDLHAKQYLWGMQLPVLNQ